MKEWQACDGLRGATPGGEWGAKALPALVASGASKSCHAPQRWDTLRKPMVGFVWWFLKKPIPSHRNDGVSLGGNERPVPSSSGLEEVDQDLRAGLSKPNSRGPQPGEGNNMANSKWWGRGSRRGGLLTCGLAGGRATEAAKLKEDGTKGQDRQGLSLLSGAWEPGHRARRQTGSRGNHGTRRTEETDGDVDLTFWPTSTPTVAKLVTSFLLTFHLEIIL